MELLSLYGPSGNSGQSNRRSGLRVDSDDDDDDMLVDTSRENCVHDRQELNCIRSVSLLRKKDTNKHEN